VATGPRLSRRRVSSGGPWEATAAYSRAVAIGNQCWVAGTTDAGPDGRSQHVGDIAAQASAVFSIVERALDEAGFAMADVVRIRMFVTDISRAPEVMTVMSDVFASIRPAATMVEVSALIDPSLLIEVEADAVRVRATQG
jgi:enamine deaminase RidA (YjgF/YER057c/UK114 family)